MKVVLVGQRTDANIQHQFTATEITSNVNGVVTVHPLTGPLSHYTYPVIGVKHEGGEIAEITLVKPIGPRPTDEAELQTWIDSWKAETYDLQDLIV